MVGHSLPEVQGLLAAIYEPFYTTKPVKADTIVEGDCFYNSWEHVEWWQAISIANKYGMMRLVTELEATVAGEMAAFWTRWCKRHPISACQCSTCHWISFAAIDYANVAERCHLPRLGSHSEAYILQHFQEMTESSIYDHRIESEDLARLNSQSWVRIVSVLMQYHRENPDRAAHIWTQDDILQSLQW